MVTALAGGPLLGERLSKHQWFGVGLGFAGVVAVVADQFGGSSTAIPVLAVIVGFTATIGMSTGSLIQRRRCSGVPMLWGTVSQYAASATVLVTIAVAGRRTTIEFTATTIWSLVWSVGVLSIVAVLTMLWLLRHRAAASVSSLFFLFPALSAIEGAVLFGERLGFTAVSGFAIAVGGVALVTRHAGR